MVSEGTDVTIKRASTLTGSPMVKVASGATLTLGTETPMSNTLTFDGGAVWSGTGYPNTDAEMFDDKSNNSGIRGNEAIVITLGTFNMYDNVIMQNNHNNASDFYLGHNGGGVAINESGTFNMYGGKIWKNSCASQAESGGGVAVAGADTQESTPSTFNMYGGEICYNSAGIGGGVCVGNPNASHDHPANFNMYGGNINNNKVGGMQVYSGAGVYVADKAVFTMENGYIKDNTAESKNGYALGGGVESVGTFNMSGGTISNNVAPHGGAGIFLLYNNHVDSIASITGGNIINNDGEGIFVNDTKSILNISGNVNISGNETTGIYIEEDAAPINVAAELTSENKIDVDSRITADGTVIATFAAGLKSSDYKNKFIHNSKKIISNDSDTQLVIGIPKYTVTVTNPTYNNVSSDVSLGTIKVTGADNLTAVPEGTELTLSIEDESIADAENHMFARWVVTKDSDRSEVTVTDNKFTMPGEAVTVKAEYTPKIKMTFYVNSALTSNECTGTWDGTSNTITFTLPDGRGTMTLSADKFTGWKYMYAEDKTPTVTSNDTVTVTVNLNKGYIYNGISSVTSQMGSGSTKLHGTFNNAVGSNTSTFTVPVGTFVAYKGEQAAEIILDIPKVEYNITKNYNTNEGSVKVVYQSNTSTQITKAYHGSTIWVGVEPKTNYKIKSVKVTDAESNEVTLDTRYVEQYNTWQFTMPINDVTIDVTFELDACEITTSATHGTISGITSPAPIGSEVVFTLTPDTYYELDTFTVKDSANEDVNCTYDSTSDSYSFTMPASNVSINAVFKKKQYTVTTSGGNVTFSVPADKYTWGDTVKFKAEPAEWYSIKQVYTNNSTVTVTPVDGEANTYSFTMPQGDITIIAETERPNHNVTFVTNGGSPVDGQVIPNGDTVSKPTTPKYVNHGFAGWYTSQTFEAGTKYDFAANVTDDVTLYARWFLWGDVNLDGDANSMDALLINRCRIGAVSYDSLNCQMAARVNDVTNTTPNSMDALLINRHRIGAIAKYPVETQTAGYEFDIETNTFITNQ